MGGEDSGRRWGESAGAKVGLGFLYFFMAFMGWRFRLCMIMKVVGLGSLLMISCMVCRVVN